MSSVAMRDWTMPRKSDAARMRPSSAQTGAKPEPAADRVDEDEQEGAEDRRHDPPAVRGVAEDELAGGDGVLTVLGVRPGDLLAGLPRVERMGPR